MSRLYDLGKESAQKNEPGAYILNDEAAEIIGKFSKGSEEWSIAIGEFVQGFSTERLRRMSK